MITLTHVRFLSLLWQAVPETLEILRGITSPISVVSGVGPQRLGKSTILNLFHSRKTSGFGLGHTMDAQTTGIWIWLRRHPRDEDLVRALERNMFFESRCLESNVCWCHTGCAALVILHVV